MSDDVKGTDTPGQAGVPGQPTDAELASMSREELLELGGKIDGVDIVFKEDRWPVEGTKAEKRAERSVSYWLLLGGVSGSGSAAGLPVLALGVQAVRRPRATGGTTWPPRCTG